MRLFRSTRRKNLLCEAIASSERPKTEVPSSFAKASVEVVPRKHPVLSKRVLKIFSTSSDSPKSTQPASFIGECSTILRIACAFLLGCPDFGLLQTRSEYLQHPLTSRAPANPFFSISSCLALRAGHAWFLAKRRPLVGSVFGSRLAGHGDFIASRKMFEGNWSAEVRQDGLRRGDRQGPEGGWVYTLLFSHISPR